MNPRPAIILPLILSLLVFITGSRAVADNAETLRRERSEITATINDAERSLRALTAELRTLRTRSEANQRQMVTAERELRQAIVELRAQQVKVEGVRREVGQLGGAIQVTERTIGQSQEYLGRRARALMQLSRQQNLEFLLRANDATELELREYMLGAVATADVDLIHRTVTAREQLEGLKTDREAVLARLVSEERQLGAARASVQQKCRALASAQSQINRVTASKEQARRQTQALLGQIRSRMNVISARLAALENVLPTPRVGATQRPSAGPYFRPEGVTLPGIYIRTPHGSPVKAMAEGEVLSIQNMHGMGQTVIVGHGGRLTSVYANLSSVGVSVGQRVGRGGTLGRSGNAPYGEMMYFAVYRAGVAQNPMGYL